MEITIIMGSKSDYETVKHGENILNSFGIKFETKILSAHRTPKALIDYVETLKDRGVKVIIAVAGKAAALPGVIAAHTTIPVIGVPMETKLLGGLDSLFSICQMPRGIPVATMGIGKSGMINAALFCIHILSVNNPLLEEKLLIYRDEMAKEVFSAEKEIYS